jgi:hypothetical protein
LPLVTTADPEVTPPARALSRATPRSAIALATGGRAAPATRARAPGGEALGQAGNSRRPSRPGLSHGHFEHSTAATWSLSRASGDESARSIPYTVSSSGHSISRGQNRDRERFCYDAVA